jgi:hypothetical protein
MPLRCGSSGSCTNAASPPESSPIGLGRRVHPRENPEGGLPTWELEELGIDAAELVGTILVTAIDLCLAERERLSIGANRAEASLSPLRRAQKIEVDLDVVHLLNAADVRVPPFAVGVEKWAAPLDTRSRVDDLVAVHSTPATRRLVLGPKWKLCDRQMLLH